MYYNPNGRKINRTKKASDPGLIYTLFTGHPVRRVFFMRFEKFIELGYRQSMPLQFFQVGEKVLYF